MIPQILEYQPNFKIQRSSTLARLLKIDHKYIVLYNIYISSEEFRGKVYNNLFKDGEKVKAYVGEMSKGSVKRMRQACELMYSISTEKIYIHPTKGKKLKFRIGFITLTLSSAQGEVSDREIKKELLEPFIRKLKKFGLINYIWKAERQKNGNLHFHMFVDCFVHLNDVRNIWNKLQAKLGYIRNFASKYGHHDPNSTDVHPVRNQDALNGYMFKYMLKPVKKVDQLEIGRDMKDHNTGKVWDCSTPLKEKNDTADFAENDELEEIEKLVATGQLRVIEKDHAAIFFYQENETYRILPERLKNRYVDFLDRVREMC